STVEPTTREEGNRRIYAMRTSRLKNEKEDDEEGWVKNFYGAKPPDVQLSSYGSWGAVGSWFGQLEHPRAQVTAGIKSKAEELISGKSSEREKTEAIYQFVATRFRYIGVSLGMGRYTPHAAEEVLSNRYGDCKDKHTLFEALLDAAGIQAYPALISTTIQVGGGVPGPGLFCHVVKAGAQKRRRRLFFLRHRGTEHSEVLACW